ncbi:MAG: hypothetical protein HC913_00130 [Microscillaceae bacterium]|nr:hypothetical protein [Microscillaceae bacterium]
MNKVFTNTSYQSQQYRKAIREALAQMPEGATEADVAIATGLPIDWVRYTLRQMLGEYPARLLLRPPTELLYCFDLRHPFQHPSFWKRVLAGGQKKKKDTLSLPSPIYQTLAYVFGELPNRPPVRHLEKMILQYLRHSGGRIVVAELVQITGSSIGEAETVAARLLAQYEGEVSVTEEGVIVYHFPALAQATPESVHITESLKIWARPEAERELHADGFSHRGRREKWHRRNLIISGLATALNGLGVGGALGLPLAGIGLLATSLTFSLSLVFFGIPAFRQLFLNQQNEKIRTRNVELYLLRGIFHRLQSQIFPASDLKKLLHEPASERIYAHWWNQMMQSGGHELSLFLTSTYQREQLLARKAQELEAEIGVDEDGRLYYAFERLRREMQVMAKLRQGLF